MAVNVNGTKIRYAAPAGAAIPLDRDLDRRAPGPAIQPPVTSSSPAGLGILADLRTHTERMKSLDPMVRRDKPDAAHQMRVATRRLRSTLRSFGRILHRQSTRRLAAELKRLGTVLGAGAQGGSGRRPCIRRARLRGGRGRRAKPWPGRQARRPAGSPAR